MTSLASLYARVPRVVLFAVAGFIQLALIAAMVIDRAGVLRDGKEITLQTRPVDPRDFLRGDYVILSYDISQIPADKLEKQGAQEAKDGTKDRDPLVFVKLALQPDGFHKAVSAHFEPVPVSGNEVLIRGRITNLRYCTSCPTYFVNYGLEKFFVPEGEGRELENARNQNKVTVVAAVTSSGRAAIKRLLLDGKPVYDEPLF